MEKAKGGVWRRKEEEKEHGLYKCSKERERDPELVQDLAAQSQEEKKTETLSQWGYEIRSPTLTVRPLYSLLKVRQ